jgi:tetratricopeptide (TPR) repeat protein
MIGLVFSLFLTPVSWAGEKSALIYNIKQFKGFYVKKNLEKATRFGKEALRLGDKILGPNHKTTTLLSRKLAGLYQAQGMNALAEPLYERYLAATKKRNFKIVSALNNLAQIYRTKGEYFKAEPLYESVLKIRVKALGQDHPESINTLNNLYMIRLRMSLGLDGSDGSLSLESLAKHSKRNGHYSKEKGISLVGIPPSSDSAADISLLEAEEGVERIRSALQLLRRNSPRSKSALTALKKKGEVVIIYDPRFPPKDISSSGARMASFFRNFFNSRVAPNQRLFFPVVVGRYIVKWERQEMAFALAHELLGHGMQHLRRRLDSMDRTDSECEARLYQEIVHQDLGIDKQTEIMVGLRQDLERRWCAPFIKYMSRNKRGEMKLWDTLNPDVPRLLALFEEYLTATKTPNLG